MYLRVAGELDYHPRRSRRPLRSLGASASEWRCTTTGLTKSAVPHTSDGKTEHAAGPDERLNALLEQYGALLHRTIVRVCPRELGLLCDDIEQEARLSLWKALQSGREIAFPISYIYKVAVSASLRAVRRAKARREDPVFARATSAVRT